MRDHPDLVKRIAACGHEIGLYGARHKPLPELGPIVSLPRPRGDRPFGTVNWVPRTGIPRLIFSLVPASKWAPAVLTDLGYSYSSSVLPAANLLCWPGAPTRLCQGPATWSFLQTTELGRAVPLFGGTYLRLTPAVVARRRAAGRPNTPGSRPPHDFDVDEERWVVRGRCPRQPDSLVGSLRHAKQGRFAGVWRRSSTGYHCGAGR